MTMNPADDEVLLEVAKAVASGSSVDWNLAESSSVEDPGVHDAVAQLKIVAHLAEVSRTHLNPHDTLPRDPSFSRTPQPLTSWGRLEIRRELGRGSYGTVYLAWDPALEREVALKVMRDAEHSAAIL